MTILDRPPIKMTVSVGGAAKKAATPVYVLPPVAVKQGAKLPPVFGNNATTFYKPHSLSTSGTGTVVNSRHKGRFT